MKRRMAVYALADIGGTNIKLGVADEGGALLARDSVKNPVREAGVDDMLALVAERITAFRDDYALSGLAVSTAGVVDKAGRIAFAGPSFPGYTGTPLVDRLSALTGLPCTAANDANCAGLGEYWLGAGQGMSPLVCITLGTGVGGCVLIGGHALTGATGFAGEIGYLPLDGGTLEEKASAAALLREIARAKSIAPETLDGDRVLALARSGDRATLDAIGRQMRFLAQGIAAVACVVNPEAFVIGGAIAKGADVLSPALETALEGTLPAAVRAATRVIFARYPRDAGMLGALYHFLREKE
ncbi:MAG: ROK family protein [Schwartzia sp.]|nr:ROK family protein [Schwartzia sp. (in: firmicutes)]